METIRPGDGALIGRAELSPDAPVVAGSVGTWTIRYTAGRYGVDDGGAFKLSWRQISDWETPQIADQNAPAYVSIETSASASLVSRFEPRGNVRPWTRTLQVRVVDGFLCPGDTLTITLGDCRGGSPGIRAQTFCQRRFRFRLFVDCFGTEIYEEVEENLGFPIVSGPAARLAAVLPSQAVVGEPVVAFVRAEDVWGNPAAAYRGTIALAAPDGIAGLPRAYTFGDADGGAHRFEGVRVARAGCHTLTVRDAELDLRAESNPIVGESAPSELRPFWGDLHGQSEETIGTNTVEDYFRFARDVAALDFSCHQGNDFQVTPSIWDEIKRQTRAFHAPGRFITFLGVEWSAVTSAGGDRNVIYRCDDGPLHRSSHWQVDEREDLSADAYPVTDLYRAFASDDVILVPHIGGRRADLRWHEANLEPVIEIHSCWGTFEWFLDEALARGYRVGFVAGSDDHKGRPGAASPGAGEFGVRGGLTCAYARDLTREALWDALRARRTSCTNGERILVQLQADGHWMGEEFAATSSPRIEVRVVGTDGIEEVTIRRGGETVYVQPTAPSAPGNRVRVVWSGARILDRNRQQTWNGGLRVDGARIVDARTYSFDTPTEGIVRWDESEVRWRSRTAGDEDGVILQLDDLSRGMLSFETEPIQFSLPLSEIEVTPRTFAAGGIGRQVVVQRLSDAPLPRVVEFAWSDPNPRSGWNSYHARIRQVNGALAWTSPVFVQYV